MTERKRDAPGGVSRAVWFLLSPRRRPGPEAHHRGPVVLSAGTGAAGRCHCGSARTQRGQHPRVRGPAGGAPRLVASCHSGKLASLALSVAFNYATPTALRGTRSADA